MDGSPAERSGAHDCASLGSESSCCSSRDSATAAVTGRLELLVVLNIGATTRR